MDSSTAISFMDKARPALSLSQTQRWAYETDEFHGTCEIAHDDMIVKCVFRATAREFYDVLLIDACIKARLAKPVSVERLAEQLAADFPSLEVTVSGRAKTHGWITSTVTKPHC
jgi:hypothetical protein